MESWPEAVALAMAQMEKVRRRCLPSDTDSLHWGAEAPATPPSSDDLLGDEGFLENTESEFYASHLRCDQPASLRGRILMEMEPHRFCDAPLILKVAIQDIQPYAVHVSWQTREHSGLHGYHVVYRSMEGAFSTEVSDIILLE